MSLINEALKRANDAKPITPATLETPLQPAQERPRRPLWILVWYAVALMLAAVLASWAIFIGFMASRQLSARQNTTVPAQSSTEAAANPQDQLKPAGQLAGSPAESPSIETKVALTPAHINTENPLGPQLSGTNPVALTAPTAEPAKPATPVFKLQGIFYRPNKPAAMINSKMVFRGDKILGAKVVAIDQESVTLDQGGEKTVLTLP